MNIALYATDGRLAKQITQADYTSGDHAITLDGQDLAAGLYLVRLESSGRVLTAKALLIR